MNKKTIIQLVVIIAGFIGTAIVLYNGFFGKSGSQLNIKVTPATNMTGVSGQAGMAGDSEKILPFGDALDFDKILSKQRLEYGIVKFPKLNEVLEVGIREELLIKPPPKKSIDN